MLTILTLTAPADQPRRRHPIVASARLVTPSSPGIVRGTPPSLARRALRIYCEYTYKASTYVAEAVLTARKSANILLRRHMHARPRCCENPRLCRYQAIPDEPSNAEIIITTSLRQPNLLCFISLPPPGRPYRHASTGNLAAGSSHLGPEPWCNCITNVCRLAATVPAGQLTSAH